MASGYAQWSPTTTYVINDVVEYAGLVYQAVSVNTNVPPYPATPVWALIGGGGGGFVQTISLAGDTISLSPSGGSVNVGSATSVASVVQKTTAQTYDTGFLFTEFNSLVKLPELQVSDPTSANPVIIDGGNAQVQIGDVVGTAPPTIDFYTQPTANANLNFYNAIGLPDANISYSGANNKISVVAPNISLDAGAGGLVEMTSAGAVDITGTGVELNAGAVSITLTPSPASPAGVFIATGTGGRVEISQGDLFMNTNDIQDVSTLQAGFLTNNTNISPDLTINAPFGNVLIEGISIDGTTITAPATNADINFAMNGTGGLTVSNTSAVGGADPMLTLTNVNTTGGTANPVKILTYKNDSNTTASDLIGEYTVRANGGGATSSTPYDYTSIKSFARGVGANNVDGSIALQVAENGTPSSANLLTYLECNGGNADVDIRKPLDMNGNNITTSLTDLTITTTGSAGTGSLSLTSKAGADISLTSGNVLNLSADPAQAVKINGNSFELSGASLLVGSAGGSSGQHLQISVNGTTYVIALLNP
jgi:hypothetical protein